MAYTESPLITLSGLNQVWSATKELYQKNLTHMNNLYTPATVDDHGDPIPASGTIANEINRLDGRIDDLDLLEVKESGYYISSVEQNEGKVTAEKTKFETTITINENSDNYTKNSPTCKAVVEFIKSIKFTIKNYDSNDDSGVNFREVSYDASSNTVVLRLPDKVYKAAFN